MNHSLRIGLNWTKSLQGQSADRRILAVLFTVGSCTVLGKLLAFLKDAVVAYQFGTSDALDAFLIAVVTATLSKKIGIALNGSLYQTKQWDGSKNIEAKKWWGTALYLTADLQDWFALALRSELFNDKEGLKGFGSSIVAHTFSANFKVDGFTFIPEVRIESSKDNLFYDKTGFVSKKGDVSFLLAAIYKF